MRRGLPLGRRVARLLHDFDRLHGAAIAYVDATSEQSPGSGHQLRDFGVRPAAKRAAQRSNPHDLLHKTESDDGEQREIARERKRLVLEIGDSGIDDPFHRAGIDKSGGKGAQADASGHSITRCRVPDANIVAAAITMTFGIHAAAAAASSPTSPAIPYARPTFIRT